MKSYTARMVHPEGPYDFPEDHSIDRDTSRDPRSVMTFAEDEKQAREIFSRDNVDFEILTISEQDTL